ncbi:hypothetical protein M430DRAFT_223762 [Amorphotheca resinae ATCC 22711]|uniref:Uncharacterized protein n=1 Tax=Amorphotheca resinae ATCC 22711 TaxID=857342 RepID=A0A2T3B6A3_AMORE|nr:hypothetical protein M430DRAFT_223762 [Amorphotheca resinae ATCC 22711]PSS22299.1 hypothetical protein M430DRAFT_223762 [Amorphotheca resinae ATCC 22711]
MNGRAWRHGLQPPTILLLFSTTPEIRTRYNPFQQVTSKSNISLSKVISLPPSTSLLSVALLSLRASNGKCGDGRISNLGYLRLKAWPFSFPTTNVPVSNFGIWIASLSPVPKGQIISFYLNSEPSWSPSPFYG